MGAGPPVIGVAPDDPAKRRLEWGTDHRLIRNSICEGDSAAINSIDIVIKQG